MTREERGALVLVVALAFVSLLLRWLGGADIY